MTVYFRFVILVVALWRTVCSQKSTYGNEFVLGMISNYYPDSKIVVDIASEKEGRLHYNIPYLNIKSNQTLKHGNTSFTLDRSLTKFGTFTEKRGIYISTDVPVTVTMTSYNDGNMESYLALPISAIGTHYRVASYLPMFGGSTNTMAGFLIVAAYDDTRVSIKGNSSEVMTLDLDTLSVQQIESIEDLTDVEITASKPVSVISGTMCANIPHGVLYCNMVLEQMIPTESSKSDTFIVPPLYKSSGFMLKVLAKHNTGFCLQNVTGTICNSSCQFSEEEFLMGTEPLVATANDSITVVQYGLGYEYDHFGGPFMGMVPSVDQYLNHYYFNVPGVYSSFKNYLSVIVPSSQGGTILLDGASPTILHRYPVPTLNYNVFVFRISTGYHTLWHSNTTVKFGALVYGRSIYTGYGFPLGFQLHVN